MELSLEELIFNSTSCVLNLKKMMSMFLFVVVFYCNIEFKIKGKLCQILQ